MATRTEMLNAAKDRIVKLRVDKNLLIIELGLLQKRLKNERRTGKWLYEENKRLEKIVEQYKEVEPRRNVEKDRAVKLDHLLDQKDAEMEKLRKENDDLLAKIELQNQTIDKLVKEIEERDSSPCMGHLR